MKTIMINLCSPLQSYGMKKVNGYVRTNLYPTKSAIAGMIACAGGIPRKDPRIKEIEESITITSKAYKLPRFLGDLREKKNLPNVIVDCQSTRATESDPTWKQKEEPTFTFKEYIADTYFRVWISGDDEKIKQYALWLDDPEWPLYLGRKCCVPSIPIFWLEENKHIFNESKEV
ncbi:type I-E CRISPR-associated protein Cas5/CasD [Enterocloster aldenensis]|uniref:type I-E CRISPR-associated protein Cas5/CasD n=1 Tax=Enterocloster aldenensis TaxID=358742 RepID=UPI000E4A801C|nr:type I-E CRISPR-associated protein Cas5/CasD [Enterocloster aldenensis]